MQIINKFLKLQKVYIFFISLVLFIIIFSTTNLQANTFKISDIEISSTFELNFKKNRVIDVGFKTSFLNLLSMITTSGDRHKIKDISTKELKSMIDSFTISDEKFINNKYSAKLKTTFNKKKSYQLLEYLLPSEDLEDLNNIQEMSNSIETYDFLNLIKKYDLKDYIILIIFKNKNELKILSKIYLNNSLKINSQKYSDVKLNNEKNLDMILEDLKNIYEDSWKKNNEINTSIKLPLTVSIDSKNYKNIIKLEEALEKIDLISDFYIINFNNQNTNYKIIYNGSPKTFFNDMSKRNFDLNMENNVWTIK